jgi:hypothetical protein
MRSSRVLGESARPKIVEGILGHVAIRVTQNLYSKSCLKGRVMRWDMTAATPLIFAPVNGTAELKTNDAVLFCEPHILASDPAGESLLLVSICHLTCRGLPLDMAMGEKIAGLSRFQRE